MTEHAASERGPTARRELVRRRVLDVGFARVEDLVREFDVSLMTMHRDLDFLESEGWLSKIRGGATANPSALVDAEVRERIASMGSEKAAMCDLAARMLTHGQTIFLDDSTTAPGLVPHIAGHSPVTVATNFVPAAQAFPHCPAGRGSSAGWPAFRPSATPARQDDRATRCRIWSASRCSC